MKMKVLTELPLRKSLKASLATYVTNRVVRVSGRHYNVSNLRIFAVHGCKCVRCGREGSRLIAWEDRGGMHIDLFAGGKNNLVLMNRDHIIPKSKKGSNSEWNLQPMCIKCNCKKGNNETDDDLAVAGFRNHWKNIYVTMHNSFWEVVPKSLRSEWLTKAFIKFRERHLYKVSYVLAKITA